MSERCLHNSTSAKIKSCSWEILFYKAQLCKHPHTRTSHQRNILSRPPHTHCTRPELEQQGCCYCAEGRFLPRGLALWPIGKGPVASNRSSELLWTTSHTPHPTLHTQGWSGQSHREQAQSSARNKVVTMGLQDSSTPLECDPEIKWKTKIKIMTFLSRFLLPKDLWTSTGTWFGVFHKQSQFGGFSDCKWNNGKWGNKLHFLPYKTFHSKPWHPAQPQQHSDSCSGPVGTKGTPPFCSLPQQNPEVVWLLLAHRERGFRFAATVE